MTDRVKPTQPPKYENFHTFLNPSLRKRSCSKNKPPVIYGRYQRNALTYRETVFVAFMNSLILFKWLLKDIFNYFGYSLITRYARFVIPDLIVHNLINGILLPIYTILNLTDKIPDFFYSNAEKTESKRFYAIQHFVEPRRYFECSLPEVISNPKIINVLPNGTSVPNVQKTRHVADVSKNSTKTTVIEIGNECNYNCAVDI